jgi:hypothetical protein
VKQSNNYFNYFFKSQENNNNPPNEYYENLGKLNKTESDLIKLNKCIGIKKELKQIYKTTAEDIYNGKYYPESEEKIFERVNGGKIIYYPYIKENHFNEFLFSINDYKKCYPYLRRKLDGKFSFDHSVFNNDTDKIAVYFTPNLTYGFLIKGLKIN